MPHLPPDRAAVVLPTARQPCNDKILPMLFKAQHFFPLTVQGAFSGCVFPLPSTPQDVAAPERSCILPSIPLQHSDKKLQTGTIIPVFSDSYR